MLDSGLRENLWFRLDGTKNLNAQLMFDTEGRGSLGPRLNNGRRALDRRWRIKVGLLVDVWRHGSFDFMLDIRRRGNPRLTFDSRRNSMPRLRMCGSPLRFGRNGKPRFILDSGRSVIPRLAFNCRRSGIPKIDYGRGGNPRFTLSSRRSSNLIVRSARRRQGIMILKPGSRRSGQRGRLISKSNSGRHGNPAFTYYSRPSSILMFVRHSGRRHARRFKSDCRRRGNPRFNSDRRRRGNPRFAPSSRRGSGRRSYAPVVFRDRERHSRQRELLLTLVRVPCPVPQVVLTRVMQPDPNTAQLAEYAVRLSRPRALVGFQLYPPFF
ncbi:hypothetical protein DFH11DRAFT_1290090 [Phellopilus nigrolimitatus]|nr:hypothetical protein DFH11DRAFT_1290090 [Phellopilus nigrolimitatus]